MEFYLRLFVAIAAIATAITFALPAIAAGNVTTCTGGLAPGHLQPRRRSSGRAVFQRPAPVVIRGGLFIGSGATFVLGSEENASSYGRHHGRRARHESGIGADPLHHHQRRR